MLGVDLRCNRYLALISVSYEIIVVWRRAYLDSLPRGLVEDEPGMDPER